MPSFDRVPEPSQSRVFAKVLPKVIIEAVRNPISAEQLSIHTWDGRNAATALNALHQGCRYTPALIPDGLARAVRFPRDSKAFGTATHLFASMTKFLYRFAHLPSPAAEIIVAFAVATWVVDCFSVAPAFTFAGI